MGKLAGLMDWIVEFVVRELYERARLDMAEPWGAVRLATALLGAHCVRVVPPRAISDNAALAWSSRGAAMYIRAGLTPRQVNHATAHALAEWNLRLAGYVASDFEEVANRIAAGLCVPRLAFERARHYIGDGLQALSHCFAVSQSLMALRIGECLGRSTALITAARVRTSGAQYHWPATPAEWRDLIAHPARAGFVVHPIHDAPGRLALVSR